MKAYRSALTVLHTALIWLTRVLHTALTWLTRVLRTALTWLTGVCEKSAHKPVQLSFFRLVYLEINPIISVNPVNKPSLSTG